MSGGMLGHDMSDLMMAGAADRVATVRYGAGPTAAEIDYAWDTLGRLRGIEGFVETGSTSYDGRLYAGSRYENGLMESRTYDQLGRLSTLSYSGSDDLPSYSFDYDAADNIVQRNGNMYQYDRRNRLIRAELEGVFGVDGEAEEQSVGVARSDVLSDDALSFNLDAVVENPELIEFDYAATSVGVDLHDHYEVTKIRLRPSMVSATRLAPEQLVVLVSDSNSSGSWQRVTGFTGQVGENGLIELTFAEPVGGRYVKVHQPFDERDVAYLPMNRSEFKNAPDDLITVYYNAPRRIEVYTYDQAGRRTSETITVVDESSSEYRYYPGTSRLMTDGRHAYQYYRNGNRTAKSDTLVVNGETRTVRGLPASYWNSITSSVADGGAGETSLAFAESSTGEQWSYEYSLRNQMTRAEKNGSEVSRWRYDGRGLRIASDRPDGTTIYTIYGRNGEIMYQRENDAERRYIYRGTVHIGAIQGTLDNGTFTEEERVWLHTDQIGSITAISDEVGDVVWNGEYTPFGHPTDPLNESPYGWVFAGKGYDPTVELYYFNARWYDATIGMFTSEDPARDGGNWYAYVGFNPLVYIDPTGLRRTREERRANRQRRRENRRERQRGRENERRNRIQELRDEGKTERADRIEARVDNRATRRDTRRANQKMEYARNRMNDELVQNSGDMTDLKDLVNVGNLAEILTDPENRQYLDEETRNWMNGFRSSRRLTRVVRRQLRRTKVIYGAGRGTMKSHLQAAESKLPFASGLTNMGIGTTVYRIDAAPGLMTESEASFLGHEALHGVQSIAAGGIATFEQAYVASGVPETDAAGNIIDPTPYYQNQFERAAYSFGPRNSRAFEQSFANTATGAGRRTVPILLDLANSGWWR